jgi:uncharacterized protein YndB with AHSA1/START domain
MATTSKAQMEVTASTTIAATPERVWELVSDTSRFPEWVTAAAAVPRTDGPAREGSTFDELTQLMGPFRAKTHWTFIESDPPRRLVWRSEDVPFASEFFVITEVAPSGDGSKVTSTLRARPSLGMLGASMYRLIKSQQRRDNERTLKKLAEVATAERPA